MSLDTYELGNAEVKEAPRETCHAEQWPHVAPMKTVTDAEEHNIAAAAKVDFVF